MATTDLAATNDHHEANQHEPLGHIVPLRVLTTVFAVLFVLTVVTVVATWVDLSGLNLWIAMGIATVKAALVVLYFMHLRYDNPFNGFIFVAALAFLWLFIGITLIDTVQYQPEIESYQKASP